MTKANGNQNLFMAIHAEPWVSDKGTSRAHYQFCIYVGKHPIGPRGGRCGWVVDGHYLGRYGSAKAAERAAEELADEYNATVLGRWDVLKDGEIVRPAIM